MDEIDDLIKAVEAGELHRVEALLTLNPELSHARHARGVSVLLWALYYGQAAIAERLAQGRSDLDLFESAALGRVERLAELLQQDPQQVNAWSPDGFQPLGLTCFFGQPEAAQWLIQSGAEISTPSNNAAKVMPLHSATASGQVEITRLLLRRGAPINARQNGGFTALHAAAQNGQLDMLDLLLAYGADLEVRTAEGKSSLDFARQGGNPAVVERLEAAAVTRRVILRPYDPTWPALFRMESAKLLPIFEPLLGAIYHIGSTSVPGLLAKPTIDILIEVTDLARVAEGNAAMTTLGYEDRGENGIAGRRFFMLAENLIHRVHVHVYQAGNPEIHRHLAFRDFLRRHPDRAEAYGDLKEELAIRFILDPEAYTNGKEAFVREMDRLAAEEGEIL